MPDDYSADRFTPGAIAVGGSATGIIETAYDQDWFAVELVAGRTYQFDLEGSPTGRGTLPDTYLRAIYDSQGRYQSGSYNDNFDGSRNSRVTFTPTESGTYYVRASGDRDEIGSYTLSVRDVTPPEAEETATAGGGEDDSGAPPNGPGSDAGALRAGATDLGDITDVTDPLFPRGTLNGEDGEVNYYRFTLSEARDVGLGLRQQDTDADLFIEDADGNVLHSGRNGGTANEWLRETLLPGTYYVRIEAQETGANAYVFRYGVREADPDEVARLEGEAGQVEAVFVPGPPEAVSPPPGTSQDQDTGPSVSEGDTDLPNDNTTPGRVAVGGAAIGTIEIPYDQDRFAVELVAGRTYQFDLTGSPGGGGTLPDTYFRAIYNSEGRYQSGTYNDNFEGSRDSRVTFTPTQSGTYYARVSGDRDEIGSYTLSVTDVTPAPAEAGQVEAVFVPGAPEPEPGTSPGHATPGGAGTRANVPEGGTDLPADNTTTGEVDVGGSVTGNIDANGDDDWFRVELEAGKIYRIDLEGKPTNRGTLEDPLLELYDGSESLIANNDDISTANLNSQMDYTATATGTYYLGAGGALETTGTYTLSVREIGTAPPDDSADLPANTSTTGEVDVGSSVTGTVESDTDSDWFAVELVAGRTYQFDLEGAPTGRGTVGDPWLEGIYDAFGSLIPDTTDDNSGMGKNSRVIFTPSTSGTYYVSAADVEGDTGTYTLSVRDVTPEGGFREGATDLPTDTGTPGVVEVDGFDARGTIGVHHDTDWFAVELEAGRTYRIDMKGGILIDPELTLRLPEIHAIYDADGTYLYNTSSRGATDDANRPHHLARVEFTPEEDGTYYIAATCESFGTGGYELRVIDITEDADEHTANRNTTGTVDVSGSATGKIDHSGDRDWFAVELEAGQEYRFDLEGQETGRGSLRDPHLRGIFDANGNLVPGTGNDDGGAGYNAQVEFTPEEDGTYYVEAAAFGYLEGTFTLSVEEVDGM